MNNNLESTSKFTLGVLPTQLGKTFVCVNRIELCIDNDEEKGRGCHIIFTMNTLLNNQQFAKRLNQIENKYGKNSVCVFASKYNGAYCHVKNRKELQGLCFDEETCPRVIIMCSNTKRFEDGFNFLNIIDKNTTNIYRIFVYFDELHEYINDSLREQIEKIDKLEKVKNMIAFTATPYKIFNDSYYWSKINLIKYDDLNDTNYVGFKDLNFICIDNFVMNDNDISYTLQYITHVLDIYPTIISDNTMTFIPGDKLQSSHNFIRDLLFCRYNNAVVVILNGVDKILQYKNNNNETITIKLLNNDIMLNKKNNDSEINTVIYNIINYYKLNGRPIIITGFICVSMGQTLTNQLLGSFTSAILGHINLSNDEEYQLFGRITGRMKNWGSKYFKTNIYCPKKTMNICERMELCARKLIENYNGEIISKNEYIEPITVMGDSEKYILNNFKQNKKKTNIIQIKEDADKSFKVFDNFEEAKYYIKDVFNKKINNRKDSRAPDTLLINGQNPSVNNLLKRMWGLNKSNNFRLIPIINGKWCVYWRPSFLTKEQSDTIDILNN